MRKVARSQFSAPSRAQEEYAEAQATRYGRASVSRPAPAGWIPRPRPFPAGAVIVTGMTDDIERSQVIVAEDGSVIRFIFGEADPIYDGRDGSLEQTDADREFTRGTEWEGA